MKTFHIHIQGIVQGVGFRPYVYQFFTSKRINGWVNNTTDGVHVNINYLDNIKELVLDLINNAPELSNITFYTFEEIENIEFENFDIVKSSSTENTGNLLLTPDFAMCEDCKSELYTIQNQKLQYPFITCTNCGPRYSITKSLPYDRETTTMDIFKMCPTCKKEYENPLDRRYYSQTNSCKECAIDLALYKEGSIKTNFTSLNYIVKQWHEGKIIAIKGVGGYLLTCDATNSETIKRLRKLKQRPTKPFALMYHDVYELSEDVDMGIGEKLELEDKASPIVLLSINKDRMTPIAFNDISPHLNTLGVMLPYTPLYKLLLDIFKKPIVATSGNLSNSTIIYQDDKIEEIAKIADLVLLNNRDIVTPQDDSVVRYSSLKNYRTVIRRSRGLAPSYINPDLKLPNVTVLAMGAMLKSTFSLLANSNIHVSQYLGNTDNYEAVENYKNTLSHFRNLFNPNIEVVLVDKHPSYFTTIYGKEIASNKVVEVVEIQHHKAHFFAVLGENNLFDVDENILGVVWDGTGFGDDGNIWGGEFFMYNKGKTERLNYTNEFPHILGDKLAKEPRISALAISSLIKNNTIIENKFSKTEWNIYQKLLKSTTLKSTSIGRLFDAAASVILEIDKQSYEGEAAMQLENAAYRYFRGNNFTTFYSYLKDENVPSNFFQYILESVIVDLDKGFDNDFIAAKFHISLAHYISLIAKEQNVKKVAFSGGVFQNQWIIELVLSFMNDDFELYFHKHLSPNDENVSFGQLMYYIYSKD